MKCHIVEDLLPEYIEEICSEETKLEIEKHLSDCENCRKKLEKMRDTEKSAPPDLEEIRPFRKIEKEMKKNRMKKVVAVVLLVIVCGVFGVLTIGQIFPTLPCPSYDSLMYRMRAKQIAREFVKGNVEDLLRASVDNPPYGNTALEERTQLMEDVKSHIKGCYEKSLKGKAVAIEVKGVAYVLNDGLVIDDTEKAMRQTSHYCVDLTLRAGENTAQAQIVFTSRDQYYLYLEAKKDGLFVVTDLMMPEDVDVDSWEYNLTCINHWLEYYRRVCQGATWGNQVLNRWMSNCNHEMAEEGWPSGMASSYFTKDCNQYGVYDKGTYYTEYMIQVDTRLQNIFKQCEESEFIMTDGQYDAEAKKYRAVLYWRITDLQGRECVMRKQFYYGRTGYEPMSQDETVYAASETNQNQELIDELKEVFDA